MRATTAAALAVLLCLMAAPRLTASEELTRAKELYRAASYDEALTALDAIPPSTAAGETVEIHQYRVLCLVALDRKDEATRAMGALIAAAPEYQLSDEDASPRVRALFAEVRRSVMPTIVQKAYSDAKAAFEKRDPSATAQFERVLTLLKDPDVSRDPALADLSTVVTGFRDLSVAASAPAPLATPAATATTAASSPAARRTITPPSNAVIVPPLPISQALPPMGLRDQREWEGEVELVISESGKVVSAKMTKPIHPAYDAEVLRAARNWAYKPATRDGVPTQMVKTVTIHLDTRPACSPRVNTNCRPTSE